MTSSTRTTPDHDLADAALAERAAAGDEGAFEALDRRHRSTLLRHCNRILRNGHDAEEAVQGALLRAYRALSAGRRPASLLPWLLAIARNECMDVLRARRETEELPPDVESRGVRPDELVVRREEARVLYADLRELPEAQREALILRSMGDLPHGEIARLLGRTAADARTLCREARLSLAECHEGRNLECAAVRERIDSGDGRALRSRRIRAHLRACDGCRGAADGIRTPGRSGLGALFPLPWLSAVRSLLSGGVPTAAAGGIGSSTLVGVPIAAVVTALVVGVSAQEGGPAHVATPSPPVAAPAIRSASPSAPGTTSTPAASVPRASRQDTPSAGPASVGAGAKTPATPTAPAPAPVGAAASTLAQPSERTGIERHAPGSQGPSPGRGPRRGDQRAQRAAGASSRGRCGRGGSIVGRGGDRVDPARSGLGCDRPALRPDR